MGCTVPVKVSAVKSPSPALCTPSLKMDPHTRKYCPGTTPAGTVSGSKANSPATGSSARSKKLCVYLHSSGTVIQSHLLFSPGGFRGGHSGLGVGRADGHDCDAVQILCPQLHAHDGIVGSGGVLVVVLGMVAQQVGLTGDGVVCAHGGIVPVCGIHVVQVDVLHGNGNHLLLLDVSIGQKEEGAVTEEVLDVVQAELGLNGDLLVAQVVVKVHDVGKAHDLGYIQIVVGKALQDCALCDSQSTLPGLLGAHQLAGLEEGVKVGQNFLLQLIAERSIGALHGHSRAVLGDGFDRNGLCPLAELDVVIGHRLDLGLGQRDVFAFTHGGAALQAAVNGCLVGDQFGARCLADGAHDAQNGAQSVPVLLELGNKIHLANRGSDLGSSGKIFGCCHVLLLCCKPERFRVGRNGRLPFACVFDVDDLLFGHFGAGVGGRGVHLRAGGGRSAHEVAPISFQTVSVLLGVLDLALIVQLQLVDILARQPHDPISILVQHPGVLQQLPELCFLGCVGVFLGLLGLVVGQRLFSGLLAAVGCIPVLFGLCAGCFFCIQLVFEFVRLLVQGVQNGLGLVIVGGFGVLQNRADVSSFECHVIVLSALARAAMLGNKV
nr:MAG TPA: hypothetical protein [Caudoviricetes sp.]DAV62342.1 MAG TPA: hypothetical protein [Caudoviricetes sp.]